MPLKEHVLQSPVERPPYLLRPSQAVTTAARMLPAALMTATRTASDMALLRPFVTLSTETRDVAWIENPDLQALTPAV